MVLHLNQISAAEGDGDGAESPPLLSYGAVEIAELLHLPLDITGTPLPKSIVTVTNHRGDSALSIFPPTEHENLAVNQDSGRISSIAAENYKISISDTVTDSDSDSSSASTFSPSVSSSEQVSTFPSTVTGASGWFCSIRELFRCRAVYLLRLRLFSSIFSSSRGIFVTYRSAASAAVLMAAVLYFRWRRRRRKAMILQERDEKINQLLDQMSLLNQILLDLHRDRRSSSAS